MKSDKNNVFDKISISSTALLLRHHLQHILINVEPLSGENFETINFTITLCISGRYHSLKAMSVAIQIVML